MAVDLKAIYGGLFIDPEGISAKERFVFAEYKPQTAAQDNTARAKIAVHSNFMGLSVSFVKQDSSVFLAADCSNAERAGIFMQRLRAIASDMAFHKNF